ncbi:MAG: D-glycero-beta-D-manno-heptose 1-phosphate adenylyltransferase [Candidatus Omnitrophota bacterium]|jgi:D-beta-D-heptose 7-phosphate kinase/D-beta-D-heptose 1-phosphate adenosyltransferase
MRDSRAQVLFQSKVKDIAELAPLAAELKASGRKIVFTNGCFDILHYGHALYLQQAAALGDLLVVGINTDASVRRLKGKNRPVVAQQYRAALVAALQSVDFVVLFDEDTPYGLIKALKPDVLVKGGDWRKEDIVGSDIVEAGGGRVAALDFVEGFSTSSIIDKIVQSLAKQ